MIKKRITQLLWAIFITLNCLAEGAENGITPFDANAPIGFATCQGSTTGSNDANPVVVTTLDELRTALYTARKSGNPTTIYIKGGIETTGYVYLQDTKNMTIYGLPGSFLYNTNREPVKSTGILLMKRCSNIILRNLTFKGAGAYDIDGNDNLSLQSSDHVWIDHCDFQDGVDGNFDCNNQANYVSVTWCRFHYLIAPKTGGSGGSNDHRFSNLWGSSDSAADDGYLNTTFANCWWDEGCVERMPRIRFGKVHLVNCLFSSSVTSYAIGIGYKAKVYVENCAFTYTQDKSHKVWKYPSDSGSTDHSYVFTGNIGQADVKESLTEDYFIPSDYYQLTAYDTKYVTSFVGNPTTGAGATLVLSDPTGISHIGQVSQRKDLGYYTTSGMKTQAPLEGITIVRKQMIDGSIHTKKVIHR